MNAPLKPQAMQFHGRVFPEEARATLYDYLHEPGWETGWHSNSKRDALTFLHKHFAGHRKGVNENQPYDCETELLVNAPVIWNAWQSIKNTIFKQHTLIRCYANGMMYGMDGTVHTDTKREHNFTAVYYPHARWSPNWGGETLFYNQEETGITGVCYPHPNCAVVFDGRIPHRAAGVTRLFPGVRITLMFKTQIGVEQPTLNAGEAPPVS